MPFRPRIAAFALACLLAAPLLRALSPTVHHPLDALTPDEYWKVYTVLRDAGKVTEKTIFTSVLLHEPDKSVVLAWKPGKPIPRRADAVLLTEGKSYEALVDGGSTAIDGPPTGQTATHRD